MGMVARQLRSYVNTNTNLREEKSTEHCSGKRGFSHKEQEKRGHAYIFFSINESQSESGTNQAAHGIICNIFSHPNEGKLLELVF